MRGKFIVESETFCDFFECAECGGHNVQEEFNFCPDCGKPTGDNEFTRKISCEIDWLRETLSKGDYVSLDRFMESLDRVGSNLKEINILFSKGSV
jgi:hypothetical protein